jgi:hypothetical protein
MIYEGYVIWRAMDSFVYIDCGFDEQMRLDKEDFADESLPHEGDKVKVEIQGRYWIQAWTTWKMKVNWKKHGF